MKNCNQRRTRAETARRLADMLSSGATLVRGMAGPGDLGYGVYLTEDLIPGARALWVNWNESPIDARLVRENSTLVLATDEQLESILARYEARLLQAPTSRFSMPAHPEGVSAPYGRNLCADILLVPDAF